MWLKILNIKFIKIYFIILSKFMVVKYICFVYCGCKFFSLCIEYIGIVIYNNVIVFDYFFLRCLEMMVKFNRKWFFLIWIFCMEERFVKLLLWKINGKLFKVRESFEIYVYM